MNQRQTMNPSTSIASLPREILLKILTGLPPKSAVRFRCTSKFFYSFIPHPRFAFTIIVSLPSEKPRAFNLYSVSYREDSHGNLQADTAQRLDVRGLLCPADGKMCLLSFELGDEAVFDLSTGRRICLPSICWHPAGFASHICSCAVLSFDSVAERYKVFKSAVYYDYPHRRRVLNRLWVLTVGVDKSWREIAFTINGYTRVAVPIHGIIYFICWARRSLPYLLWDAFDPSELELKIVAMDVATESFITSIPFPLQPWQQGRQSSWMKLNGRLAFGTSTPWPDRIDIWTLKESMEYWEKQTVLLPLKERDVIREAIFMRFTANSIGEIVFLIQRMGIVSPLVLVYSFEREVWRRFKIH